MYINFPDFPEFNNKGYVEHADGYVEVFEYGEAGWVEIQTLKPKENNNQGQ